MTDAQIFNGLLAAYELGRIVDITDGICISNECPNCPASGICSFLAEGSYETFEVNLKAFHKRYTQKYYPEYLI